MRSLLRRCRAIRGALWAEYSQWRIINVRNGCGFDSSGCRSMLSKELTLIARGICPPSYSWGNRQSMTSNLSYWSLYTPSSTRARVEPVIRFNWSCFDSKDGRIWHVVRTCSGDIGVCCWGRDVGVFWSISGTRNSSFLVTMLWVRRNSGSRLFDSLDEMGARGDLSIESSAYEGDWSCILRANPMLKIFLGVFFGLSSNWSAKRFSLSPELLYVLPKENAFLSGTIGTANEVNDFWLTRGGLRACCPRIGREFEVDTPLLPSNIELARANVLRAIIGTGEISIRSPGEDLGSSSGVHGTLWASVVLRSSWCENWAINDLRGVGTAGLDKSVLMVQERILQRSLTMHPGESSEKGPQPNWLWETGQQMDAVRSMILFRRHCDDTQVVEIDQSRAGNTEHWTLYSSKTARDCNQWTVSANRSCSGHIFPRDRPIKCMTRPLNSRTDTCQ